MTNPSTARSSLWSSSASAVAFSAVSPRTRVSPALAAARSAPLITPEKYGFVMSGTNSAILRVRPDSSAWAVGLGTYPRRSATASTCSRVRWLTRCGRENARDTVDDATPAAVATSASVGRRPCTGVVMNSIVARNGKRLPCDRGHS